MKLLRYWIFDMLTSNQKNHHLWIDLLFCLGKLTMVPFEKLSTPLGSKEKKQPTPKRFPVFWGFHSAGATLSVSRRWLQGKYEDAEQVKSAAEFSCSKSGFWGATSRCGKNESYDLEALWKWQEGCFFKAKWRLSYVCPILTHQNLPRMRLDLLQEKADAKRKEARYERLWR